MSGRVPFLDARAKARVVLAIKAFELQTCAELAVTVKKQVRLACGDFSRGFVHVQCLSCRQDMAVAFSCKQKKQDIKQNI